MKRDYDFCGWATKNNVRCSDGRTIMQDAFADQNGKVVPLVWQHQHNSLENVLGKAYLENRKEGVYAYCKFNDTYMGNNAKQLVAHGDITSLSIFANQLKQSGGNVIHGNIRELSLVLAGANPEAIIESVSLAHSDDGDPMEAIIFSEEPLELTHSDEANYVEEDDIMNIEHSDLTVEDIIDSMSDVQRELMLSMVETALEHGEEFSEDDVIAHADDQTVADVIDSMSDTQKKVMYYLIDQALAENATAQHSDLQEDETMKYNVFDTPNEENEVTLSHDAMQAIIDDARDNRGSLKQAFLAHAAEYGIDHIDYLFPDYKTITKEPTFIKDDQDWVQKVMSGVKHVPFSRIKSIHADITADEARAKGYVKGDLKLEEVFGLLQRTTDPQTVYKKQKLDKDDIIDITDFNVVAWLKTEMRLKLNEELARAMLLGDGRSTLAKDKIKPDHIRPIWQDASLYTVNKVLNVAASATDDEKAKAFIKMCVKARKEYKGSGNPTLFTTEENLCNMLLLEDTIGHRIYKTLPELATALMVKEIVTVPPMEGAKRTAEGGTEYQLEGIIVNLSDYAVGADKGGAVNMFEDFDIDYNQEKYLIETRCSSTLTVPYAAITIESTQANG